MYSFSKRTIFFWLVILLITFLGICLFSCLFVSTPELSHDSGFYMEDFQLNIVVPPYTEVYYTLDGSLPDRDSYRYTEPLIITNSSENPNTHSMRTDIAACFYTDLIEKYMPVDAALSYQVPDYLVDKCTVLRAVAINSFGITSEIVSASYFVEISPADYPNCNIISLITDPNNLFDPESGIYVTGNTFEDYIENEEPHKHWRFWEANYRQQGSDWERDAVFHFFDTNGNLVLEENGGIRIRGGVSRGTLPRSLNLYAREYPNASDTFDYPLFNNDYIPETVSLSAGGNQLMTQFNDYMMTQRVRDRNFATMLFEPYVMFLDGEYWGYYWLTEKFDETYFKHYYNIDPDNCIIIKEGELEAGRSSDLALYNNMEDYIISNDMSVPENYAKACEMIDIDSCLDYFSTMVYIARDEDWPHANWAMWRTRIPEESPYGDTKWRWILYDCNSTSMSSYGDNTDSDTLSVVMGDPLFSALWENSSFREAFQVRILEIADTNFNAREMDVFIQKYARKMEPILAQSWKRFYGSDNDIQVYYYETMERIRQFFLNRKPYVEKWFSDTVN